MTYQILDYSNLFNSDEIRGYGKYRSTLPSPFDRNQWLRVRFSLTPDIIHIINGQDDFYCFKLRFNRWLICMDENCYNYYTTLGAREVEAVHYISIICTKEDTVLSLIHAITQHGSPLIHN